MIIIKETNKNQNMNISQIFKDAGLIIASDNNDNNNKTDINNFNNAYTILKNVLNKYTIKKYDTDQPYRICIYNKNNTKNILFFIRDITAKNFKIITNIKYEDNIKTSLDTYKKKENKKFSCEKNINSTYDKVCFSFSNVNIVEKEKNTINGKDVEEDSVFVNIIKCFITTITT